MIRIYSFRTPSSSLWVFFWYHGRDREKEEKHMGPHPDHAIWFPKAPGQSHSSGWLFLPPAAVALGFFDYKLLLSFSRINNTFLGNFRTTTYPSNLIFLICKEQPVLTQTSISTFSSQLTFGQNFHQLWLLPANHSYYSFYLLNNPVKSVIKS